nr:putative NaTx Tcis49 [Tityus cisandinus]
MHYTFVCLFVLLNILSGVEGTRDGFILDRNHCKIKCFVLGSNSMCETMCTRLGATAGYCSHYACFCTNLKDEVKIWGDAYKCKY